jgi:TonB family protein
MNARILALVLLASAAAPPSLVAQQAPPQGRLREVLRADDGTVLAIDTASVVRQRGAVFAVHRVVQFPAPRVLPDSTVVDQEVDYEELDCAAGRQRAFLSMLYLEDSLVDARRQVNEWAPVPDSRAAAFRATCDVLRSIGQHDYELAQVEEQPALVNVPAVTQAVSREYPPELRDGRVTGTVTLRFRVLADGSVDPGSVRVEAATHPAFGEAARRVALTMRFRPARVRRRPVAVWVILPVVFRLSPEQ